MAATLSSAFLPRGLYQMECHCFRVLCVPSQRTTHAFHLCWSSPQKKQCGGLGSGSYWHPKLLQKSALCQLFQRKADREESLLVWVALSKGAQGRDLYGDMSEWSEDESMGFQALWLQDWQALPSLPPSLSVRERMNTAAQLLEQNRESGKAFANACQRFVPNSVCSG